MSILEGLVFVAGIVGVSVAAGFAVAGVIERLRRRNRGGPHP